MKNRVHLTDKLQTYCGIKTTELPKGDRWVGAKYKSDAPVKVRCERCFENEAKGFLQPTYMRDMKDAPLDGSRILLKYTVTRYEASRSRHIRHLGPLGEGFRTGSYVDVGEKWEECRWMGSHWQPWGGDEGVFTTYHIDPDHCLGWRPLPENE